MLKPVHEKRKMRFTVRFTEDERDFIATEADVSGLSAAALIRQRALGHRVAAKADMRVLAELRRLGGLLKHIHNESKGAYSADTSRCLKEIAACVNRLGGAIVGKRGLSE